MAGGPWPHGSPLAPSPGAMLATPGCTAVLGTAEVALGRAGQVVARPAARPGSSQAVLVVVLEPLSKPRSPIKSLLFVSRCCC